MGNTRTMDDSVMIFAPAARLTVTIEQPSDEVELHLHAGGQGIWQARMVALLGVPVTLCACVGGEVGRALVPLLDMQGVRVRTIGRQATSGWYVHDRRHGERVVVAESPTAPLNRHEIDELYGLALAEGLRAQVSVLSGPDDSSVLPADVYRRLAADLSSDGRVVVADLSGDHASAALSGGVAFLKMGHDEAVRDGWAASDSDEHLIAALGKLHRAGAGSVFLSRAERSSLALLDGEVVEVRAPRLEVTDPRGAGDSLTAGVAAVLARRGNLRDAVCTGAAAGTVNVTQHGLGTGHAEAVAEISSRIELESVRS
jgi:1-phosphofructokinase